MEAWIHTPLSTPFKEVLCPSFTPIRIVPGIHWRNVIPILMTIRHAWHEWATNTITILPSCFWNTLMTSWADCRQTNWITVFMQQTMPTISVTGWPVLKAVSLASLCIIPTVWGSLVIMVISAVWLGKVEPGPLPAVINSVMTVWVAWLMRSMVKGRAFL